MYILHRALLATAACVVIGLLIGGYYTVYPVSTPTPVSEQSELMKNALAAGLTEAEFKSMNFGYSTICGGGPVKELANGDWYCITEESANKPVFDPLAGHHPDTNVAIARFCNAEAVRTAWSIGVESTKKYFLAEQYEEALVITYTTGDWLILKRDIGGDCVEMDAAVLAEGSQTIDELTAPLP